MLEVGFSRVTITPPLGTPLGGYENRKKNAMGIHDEVSARCMLFKESATNTLIALIVCDLLWITEEFALEIGQIAEKMTRGVVKKENVILHAIHTHSSQRIMGGLEFFYKKVSKPHNVDKGWYIKHGVPYLKRVIASSVYGALYDLQPALIKANISSTEVGHNRRYNDPASQVVDRDLLAMVFLKEDGEIKGENVRGIFYNLANHCVALGEENYLISQDWPYYAHRVLKSTYQLPWNSQIIFGQSTAGNVNPWNCIFDQEVRKRHEAEKVGLQTAADVIRTLRPEDLKTISGVQDEKSTLKLISKKTRVEITDPAKIELFQGFNLTSMGYIIEGKKHYLELPLSIIQINDIIIACVPGEPFSEFGVAIKKEIRGRNENFFPIVLELTMGASGYIIPRDSYNKTKGYEESLAVSSETGYLVVEAIKEMLREL
ncbi:neutral/alkaline non-lysosomal ceramidase N-terminal domain-containing protein [Candidatus Lokiarchaeum ossiferum]|uniref:neutral/alkaline non-lysosomal ceramidase N-terminal domain-containing protein n=1 Tax=Candidatus Lokiarchaeum ossiferum TaxID=2951803 RepID=UPI00352F7A3D